MDKKNISLFRRYIPFVFTLIAIIADQLTKAIIVRMNDANDRFLELYNPEKWIRIIGDWLRIRLGYNNNMIFGLDIGIPENIKPFILILTTLIALVVIIAIYTRIKQDRLFPRICFGLIIGGALGNLFDRLFGWIFFKGEWKLIFDKGVVDWIDFGIPKGMFGLENGWRWYTFNIADSFITISIVLLIIYIIATKNDDFFKESKSNKKTIEKDENGNEESKENLEETDQETETQE